jgi:serine/threonine-protein kinase
MLQTDLGACEWFVWDLRRSNLIDRGQLDQIVGEFLTKHPGAEPPALAEYLVKKSILTQFQADRLLQGKTQGFVLGPFMLKDSLGTGSMGTVYKAQSKSDNKWYAVKVLPRRSMWNVRIARRKVRAFETCQHPSVVPFTDVGTAGGMHYLAWPMVEGETLDKVVQRESRLSPGAAAGYAIQVAEGLEAVHKQGLFHGLLKPSNLMIDAEGTVRILDFGIGCLLAETEGESLVDTMSTANSVSSGLDCSSPESIMDPTNLTPAGDQYSLGCVLYFCLTGRYPFPDGTAVEKMMAHQHKQPTPIAELNPAVPAELVAVIDQLMQKAPADRFPGTTEVIQALRPFAAGASPAKATRTMPRPAAARPERPSGPQVPARSNGSASSRSGHETPPPGMGPTVAPTRAPGSAAALPTRHTLQKGRGPAVEPPPPPPSFEPEEPESFSPATAAASGAPEPTPRRSWDERIGPIGITICAVLVCVLAWLLTYKLF